MFYSFGDVFWSESLFGTSEMLVFCLFSRGIDPLVECEAVWKNCRETINIILLFPLCFGVSGAPRFSVHKLLAIVSFFFCHFSCLSGEWLSSVILFAPILWFWLNSVQFSSTNRHKSECLFWTGEWRCSRLSLFMDAFNRPILWFLSFATHRHCRESTLFIYLEMDCVNKRGTDQRCHEFKLS